MKEITIDYSLRATWQSVARMYNEEAKKFGSTMAVGFTLLSIDPKKGHSFYLLGPENGNGSNKSVAHTQEYGGKRPD